MSDNSSEKDYEIEVESDNEKQNGEWEDIEDDEDNEEKKRRKKRRIRKGIKQ